MLASLINRDGQAPDLLTVIINFNRSLLRAKDSVAIRSLFHVSEILTSAKIVRYQVFKGFLLWHIDTKTLVSKIPIKQSLFSVVIKAVTKSTWQNFLMQDSTDKSRVCLIRWWLFDWNRRREV